MINMTHARFSNTKMALIECIDAINDGDAISEDMHEREIEARDDLYALCRDYMAAYETLAHDCGFECADDNEFRR